MSWYIQPWPWWLSGILIGLTVPLLYLLAGKAFGISTSLQQIGAMCCPRSNIGYFREYDRENGLWLVVFVVGIAVGGYVGSSYLAAERVELLPASFRSLAGGVKLFVGGCLVGFGARYAGGCTSGHSITGISNLNVPSLVATGFFFAGGLAVTWGLGHLLF